MIIDCCLFPITVSPTTSAKQPTSIKTNLPHKIPIPTYYPIKQLSSTPTLTQNTSPPKISIPTKSTHTTSTSNKSQHTFSFLSVFQH